MYKRQTYNICPKNIREIITDDTQAILATHVFGNPVNIEALDEISKTTNVKIIYDAAHCFGVSYKGKSVLEYGDISTLSTHATKIFHTVEGGFLHASSKSVEHKIALMKNFGHDGPDKFSSIGINAKNSEFHAAMGLANLDFMDIILERRKAQYLLYLAHLSVYSGLQFQTIRQDTDYNYSYFPVIFPTEAAVEQVQKRLQENDIIPRRYFYPSLNNLSYVDYMPAPNAERIAKQILCLPLYHELEDSSILHICDLIKSAI